MSQFSVNQVVSHLLPLLSSYQQLVMGVLFDDGDVFGGDYDVVGVGDYDVVGVAEYDVVGVGGSLGPSDFWTGRGWTCLTSSSYSG